MPTDSVPTMPPAPVPTVHRAPRRRWTSRRVAAALAATTVALPMATVVLAAPALAVDRSVAHGFRWAPAPSASAGSYGPSGGYGYGGYGGYGYGGGSASPYGQGSGSGGSSASQGSSTTGGDTSTATETQETGLVTISTVIDAGQGEAAGTGIVLTSGGVVVTNHHVVEGATSIKVTVVSTGTTYTADLLGSSTTKDVAVLQLEDASGLTPVTTDTSAVATGDSVTAVGDAGGDGGDLTAAPGTVTALSKSITVADEETGGQHRLRRLMEVSSDIIPGDSGGALRAADGDVVGMNVAASSSNGTGSGDTTGYVIPISRVLKVEQAVLAGQTPGDVELGYDPFLGIELDARSTSTAVAGVVDSGPAAGAGITAGDTITAIGGTAVSTADALRAAIATHAVGDTVTVTWTDASGASHTADVTLTQAPIA